MRRLVAILCLFMAAAAAPAAAQTAEEQARIDWALGRGRLLYEIDRAAWVTTDDMRARLGERVQATIRGWTVEREGDFYIVTYYAGDGDGRVALYRGRVQNRRVVSRDVFAEGARPPLTPVQRRLSDAFSAVARLDVRACVNARFNAAVIPPETPDGPIDIYALTPQLRTGYFPIGGHFRATLSPAGEIVAQRAFTNSCLEMPAPPRGSGFEGIGTTHLLDPIPTEIHVFLSVWTGMPIFVGTREPARFWIVRPDRIELVDPERAPKF